MLNKRKNTDNIVSDDIYSDGDVVEEEKEKDAENEDGDEEGEDGDDDEMDDDEDLE